MNQIAVAGDRAGDLAAKACLTIEGLLDVLNREVGVAPVDHLEESDLRVASQVDILSTISDLFIPWVSLEGRTVS